MKYEIHPELNKTLLKIGKKNKTLIISILKKINEICSHENPHHYKNLRKPLQDFKRVHIESFVLIFKIKEEKIIFRYFDHHDKIYNKKKRKEN